MMTLKIKKFEITLIVIVGKNAILSLMPQISTNKYISPILTTNRLKTCATRNPIVFPTNGLEAKVQYIVK